SALSCIKNNEYSSALPYLQQSIDIQKQIFHRDHLNLTFTYDQIGFVYEKLNQPNEALSFYELSLNIRKKILPNNHIDLAESYDNMANEAECFENHRDAKICDSVKLNQQGMVDLEEEDEEEAGTVDELMHLSMVRKYLKENFTEYNSYYGIEDMIEKAALINRTQIEPMKALTLLILLISCARSYGILCISSGIADLEYWSFTIGFDYDKFISLMEEQNTDEYDICRIQIYMHYGQGIVAVKFVEQATHPVLLDQQMRLDTIMLFPDDDKKPVVTISLMYACATDGCDIEFLKTRLMWLLNADYNELSTNVRPFILGSGSVKRGKDIQALLVVHCDYDKCNEKSNLGRIETIFHKEYNLSSVLEMLGYKTKTEENKEQTTTKSMMFSASSATQHDVDHQSLVSSTTQHAVDHQSSMSTSVTNSRSKNTNAPISHTTTPTNNGSNVQSINTMIYIVLMTIIFHLACMI
ncbi:unnamed protein product, partial [Adineta steineri]